MIAFWLIAAIAGFSILAILVRSSAARNYTHNIFIGILIAMALWAAGLLIFLNTHNSEMQYFAAKLFYAASAAFPPLLLIFAIIYPRRNSVSYLSYIIAFSWVSIIVMLVAILLKSDFILSLEAIRSARNDLYVVDRLTYSLFALHFCGFFFGAMVVSFTKFFTAKGVDRTRIGLYAQGMLLASIPGFYVDLYLPSKGDYSLIWLGPVATFLFIGLVAYSIIRHNMFDVKAVAVRTLAYALSITMMAGIYFGLAYVTSVFLFDDIGIGTSTNSVNVGLALLLAFIFQPIKNFFDKITNSIFFRDQYNTDDFLTRLGTIFTSADSLDALLERAATEVAQTLKATSATFVVYGTSGAAPVMKGYKPISAINKDASCALQQYLRDRTDQVVSVDQISPQIYEHTKLGRTLRSVEKRGVSVMVPLEDELGYLLLGEQQAGGYSGRDIRVLRALIGELSVAVQNSLSLQEVRNLNETLQKRIDDATKELRETNEKLLQLDETKDEFISMASHQLRTPLTSIKGYLSMVLDGDAGKVSEQQRALLNEAFGSSERMVRLISDFLNVSRLQTGKFMIDTHPINLADLVSEEVESIRHMAESHAIELEYLQPKRFPVLMLDGDKLRQVVMNFIDNAIYYSPAESIVKVKVVSHGGEVRFEVHDQGMGVPDDEQDRLFTKFFRAENARRQRPDGTGVGLYLAKKVITEHGGNIIFRTRRGKGSIFGFRLPVAPLRDK